MIDVKADNPLNAQQLQQIQANAERQMQQIVAAMNLRKWAVEQAFEAFSSTSRLMETPTQGKPPDGAYVDPLAMAAAIYDFVSQPANVKIELSP